MNFFGDLDDLFREQSKAREERDAAIGVNADRWMALIREQVPEDEYATVLITMAAREPASLWIQSIEAEAKKGHAHHYASLIPRELHGQITRVFGDYLDREMVRAIAERVAKS